MTCKDCLHYEVCESYSKRESLATLYCAEECLGFTDKSEWVHLLVRVGDQVFVMYGYEIQHTSVYSMKIESEDDHFVFIIKCMVSQGGARFEKFIFGKTVFLTHEEADKALKNRRKEDEGK